MATDRGTQTSEREVDHLERAQRAIERLEAISFIDAAKGRKPRPADGPLVRAARRLERLLGMGS